MSDTNEAQPIRLDASDDLFRGNPHQILDKLRSSDPVHQDQSFDRVVLTRASEVAAVLADRSLSVDPYKARPGAFGRIGLTDEERGRHSMVFLDDPDHARLRGLVTQAFSATAVESMRSCVEEIAGRLLEAIDRQSDFDLVAAYATPLPILVIANMLGIEDGRIEDFKRWSDETTLFFDPKRTEEQHSILWNAIKNLNDSLAQAIEERRKQPREDLISGLISAQADGDRLSTEEILDTCRALLVAGNITTTDLIGNGVVALLQHPEQTERLQNDPGLWPDAIEEILRYDPPISSWNRQVLDDRQVGGCPVHAGQTVTSMLLAANHDPALHDHPHRFDIDRGKPKHYSFGGGSHFCLGASLARVEAQIALSLLFARFPNLRFARDNRPMRKSLPGFSGFQAIWLSSR